MQRTEPRISLSYRGQGEFIMSMRDGTEIEISREEFLGLLRDAANIASMELRAGIPLIEPNSRNQG